jgi:arylsulfatase A-like enzyme
MTGESSLVTVDAAIDFMRKHAAGPQPFLAVVWFGSPHKPHQALAGDRVLYAEAGEQLQHFYGEITAMDRAFGKLRDEIGALGIRENTILWYCSDNGGLPNIGSTGGRGDKGDVYEGGLRVPGILEWPERVPSRRVTHLPCNTSDIYPTLLDIAGVRPPHQPPLDGVSLVPLLDGRMNTRPKPIGFWDYPAKGIRTPSKEWMAELLEAQAAGKDVADPARLRLDAGHIDRTYPQGTFPGHSAWLDWPWKLHRIEGDAGRVRLELYNLAEDPDESTDLANNSRVRTGIMRAALDDWLASVVRSLNGHDYR